jgi:predicted amidohydrolase
MGAEAVLAPRATVLRTAERWKIVFRANALTSTMFVLSVNRPAPEQGVLIGGPSFAVAPDGRVLLESTETVSVVALDRSIVAQARHDYPGYLPIRSDVYAKAWSRVPPKGYGPA